MTISIRPGEQIVGARSGTVGGLSTAIVQLTQDNVQYIVSAAHVLCSSPFECGHAAQPVHGVNGAVGEHHQGHVAVSIRCDIGFARLAAGVQMDASLAIPDLHAGEIAPTGAVADQTYPGAGVWKFGARTGLTRGRVESTSTVRLPYADGVHELPVAVVTSDGHPFSKKGDSGAVVYYQSGEALGVVIGARDYGRRSYVSPLADVVRAMDCA